MTDRNAICIDELVQLKDVLAFMKLICFQYSPVPNDVLKKKYYDVLSNIPVYYPNKRVSNKYIQLLNTTPLTSYLDSRTDLLHWMHFVESQCLGLYGEPILPYDSWFVAYHDRYERPYYKTDITDDNTGHYIHNDYVIYGIILTLFISIIKYNM